MKKTKEYKINKKSDLDNIDLENKIIALNWDFLLIKEEKGYILRNTRNSYMGGLVGYTKTPKENIIRAKKFFNNKTISLFIFDNIGDFYLNYK